MRRTAAAMSSLYVEVDAAICPTALTKARLPRPSTEEQAMMRMKRKMKEDDEEGGEYEEQTKQ